jgi:hypothetical protein
MAQGQDGFRKRDRLELHVPVRVRCRETDGTEWHELSRLEDVTQFGASFALERRIDVGRILHLTTPLPWRLRLFDQAADLYRVYALVRWVRPAGEKRLVGVAFVGKTPPASYLHDPSRLYGTEGFSEKRRESRIEAAIQVCVDDRRGGERDRERRHGDDEHQPARRDLLHLARDAGGMLRPRELARERRVDDGDRAGAADQLAWDPDAPPGVRRRGMAHRSLVVRRVSGTGKGIRPLRHGARPGGAARPVI